MSALSSETLHATCVAIGGRGVLLAGRSGSGKSDLALRLLDRGAVLVADDYTLVTRRERRLWGTPPATIAGRLEVRGVGIVARAHLPEAPLSLIVDLEVAPARLPETAVRRIAGIDLPCAALAPFEASAAIKVELLLERLAS